MFVKCMVCGADMERLGVCCVCQQTVEVCNREVMVDGAWTVESICLHCLTAGREEWVEYTLDRPARLVW